MKNRKIRKRKTVELSDIEVDINLDEGIGKWAGECPSGCEKIYAEWVFDGEDVYGYFYIDKKELRQGEFVAYYSNGNFLFKCSYKDNKEVGLAYHYVVNDGDKYILYFDNEIINIEEERKYLAIQRLRDF